MQYLIRFFSVAIICLALTSCSGGGTSSDAPTGGSTAEPDLDGDNVANAPTGTQGYRRDSSIAQCSTQDLNAWVDFDMHDYYIYYDQVPQVNLADYSDTAELVRDLRVDPDVYSYLADAEEQNALREEGLRSGYGFSARDDQLGAFRFRRIWAGSPMDKAGIKRGDQFLEINGISVDGMSDALFSTLLFDDGVEPIFTVQTDGEQRRRVRVVAAEYRWETSPIASVFTMEDGQKIGYLLVEAFYQPTEAEMDSHLYWLIDQGINDFILDLRYNRGGSVRISERLASQIAGPALADELFQIRRRNNKYSELDRSSFITDESPSLSLPRLVILTSEQSASASETIINGLQPHLDVTVIGAKTSGKPFTSRSIEYCGKNLNAMHSIRTNSAGVSVLGGIQPNCAIADQWVFETNDSRDALTSAALTYLNTATCESQVVANSRSVFLAANQTIGEEPGNRLSDLPQSYED